MKIINQIIRTRDEIYEYVHLKNRDHPFLEFFLLENHKN